MMRHSQQLLHSMHCANLDKENKSDSKIPNDLMTTYLLAENVHEKRRSANVIDIIISSFNQ